MMNRLTATAWRQALSRAGKRFQYFLLPALVLIGGGFPERGRPHFPQAGKGDGVSTVLFDAWPSTAGRQEKSAIYIIDLHADTLTELYKRKNLDLFLSTDLQVTLPFLKQGGVKGQFFAVWTPADQGKDYAQALIRILEQLIARHADEMAPARSAAEFEANLKAGKISAFLALEGGHVIGDDLDNLNAFYEKGVRYMTLTWNDSNLIADAAKDKNPPCHGLSPFGEKIVKRMNELGMIIDVSHTSAETVADVLALSRDPIIASHSDCAAIQPHFRNLTDDQIRAICAKGGVIGVNFHSPFLSADKQATLAQVADHIDHLRQVGGIQCVAIGSDFDGKITPPQGLADASQFGNLTQELIKRGYTSDDLAKIYALNFLRVLRRVVDE